MIVSEVLAFHNIRLLRSGLLILLFTSLQGCFNSDSIVFHKISKLRFEKRGNETFLAADVVLENTSSFRCRVFSTEADIEIDNKRLGGIRLLQPMKLEPHSRQEWPCRLDISFSDLMKTLPSGLELIVGDKKIPARVKGTVDAKVFFFKKSFPFDVRQDLDAKTLGSLF
ncbi:MAG: LEA type 2 family protein [Bacteroidota bacterium]